MYHPEISLGLIFNDFYISLIPNAFQCFDHPNLLYWLPPVTNRQDELFIPPVTCIFRFHVGFPPRRPPAQCELFDRACDPIHLGALESNDPSHERIPGLSGLSRYQSSPCKCPEPSELSSAIRSNKPQVKFLTDRLIEGSLIH